MNKFAFVLALSFVVFAGCTNSKKIRTEEPLTLNVTSTGPTALEVFEDTCEIDHSKLNVPTENETQRLSIHNVKNGAICGSKDGGKTWTHLGHVILPIEGGVWKPTQRNNKVFAFNFLRGESNVFASAINNLHIRLSDPAGYVLPADTKIQPIHSHAVSIAPKETLDLNPIDLADEDGKRRVAVTDIPGGQTIFSGEWTSRIGAAAYMGDGKTFAPIPYDLGPNANVENRSYILIVTAQAKKQVEYLEFENKKGGLAYAKYEGEELQPIARVTQAVRGIGRFDGSGFLQMPGQVRANHPGVLDIGTTDVNIDPTVDKTLNPPAYKQADYFGGFQIVPSHHYEDTSMSKEPKGIAHEVYMVLAPLTGPTNGLERYDLGLEGTFPLFKDGLHAGKGTTYFQFGEGTQYIELNDAVKQGMFKHKEVKKVLDTNGNPVLDANGKPVTTETIVTVEHLRGKILDALTGVTKIKLVMK